MEGIDGVRPCCQKPENLELQPLPNPDKPELALRVCRECGSRHFELTVDPGEIGLTTTSLE